MENIIANLLYEEDVVLAEDVKGIIDSLNKWFREKKSQVKEAFSELKKKVIKSTDKEKQSEIKENMIEAQGLCNDAIQGCNEGLTSVKNGDVEKAKIKKTEVLDNIVKLTKLITKIGATMSLATAVISLKDKELADKIDKVNPKTIKKNVNQKVREKQVAQANKYVQKYNEKHAKQENYELEYEEEVMLAEGVKEILDSLGKWFKEKKEQVKNSFRDLKQKALKKIGEVDKEKQAEVRENINKAQQACNEAIQGCSDGLAAVSKGDGEKAKEEKEKVADKLKRFSSYAGIIVGALKITLDVAAMASPTVAYHKLNTEKKVTDKVLDVYGDVVVYGPKKAAKKLLSKKKKEDAEINNALRIIDNSIVEYELAESFEIIDGVILEENMEYEYTEYAFSEGVDLDCLLEAEGNIRERISKTVDRLKQWFKEKIVQVKEAFRRLKNKIAGKLNPSAKKALVAGQQAANTVVRDCNEGIQAVSNENTEVAQEKKSKVVGGLKILGAIGALAVVAVGGVRVGKKIKLRNKKLEVTPENIDEIEAQVRGQVDVMIQNLTKALNDDYEKELEAYYNSDLYKEFIASQSPDWDGGKSSGYFDK